MRRFYTDHKLKWLLNRVMPGLSWSLQRSSSDEFWRNFKASREGVNYTAQFRTNEDRFESSFFVAGNAVAISSAPYDSAILVFVKAIEREARKHRDMANKLEDATRRRNEY